MRNSILAQERLLLVIVAFIYTKIHISHDKALPPYKHFQAQG